MYCDICGDDRHIDEKGGFFCGAAYYCPHCVEQFSDEMREAFFGRLPVKPGDMALPGETYREFRTRHSAHLN